MAEHSENQPSVVIRPLEAADAAAAAELSGQLGYPCSSEDLRLRILALSQSEDRIALAATRNGELVAWADASVERHLQGEDSVVLGGLVVREDTRGLGIGRQLCFAIEAWTRQKGIAVLRVRSQTKREDAHRFYLRDGFRQVKTSLVFEKNV